MKKAQKREELKLVSMRFPARLWKRLRLRAVRDDTTATKILAKLAEGYLAEKTVAKKKEGD